MLNKYGYTFFVYDGENKTNMGIYDGENKMRFFICVVIIIINGYVSSTISIKSKAVLNILDQNFQWNSIES